MYRVSTPCELFSKTTAIKKVYTSSGRKGREDEIDIARIEFHSLRSSKMYFDGREYNISNFFDKGSNTIHGRKRSFIGPGGVRYVWKPLSGFNYELYTEHGKHRTTVAFFKHKTFGSSTFEIFLSPQDVMCDWALVTFLCVYHKRVAQRNAAAATGGAA